MCWPDVPSLLVFVDVSRLGCILVPVSLNGPIASWGVAKQTSEFLWSATLIRSRRGSTYSRRLPCVRHPDMSRNSIKHDQFQTLS